MKYAVLNGTTFFPPQDFVMTIAQSKKHSLKSYVGVVSINHSSSTAIDSLTIGVVCESEKPTTLPPVPIFYQYESRGVQYLGCPKGYKDLNSPRE
jgi:hypothetical protein